MKVAVIGSGPAGYLSALLISRKGAEVTVYEKKDIGGVCLNRGCVPTKHLIFYAKTLKKARELGMSISEASVEKAVSYAKSGADFFKTSVSKLLEKERVKIINSEAVLQRDKRVIFEDGSDSYDAIVIAVGSRPLRLKVFEGLPVITGEDYLNFKDWKSVAVIGAGAQGVEIASFFALMGSEVYLIEALERILPSLPGKVSQLYEARLKRNGIKVLKAKEITEAKFEKNLFSLKFKDGEEIKNIEQIIVTAGRVPNTECIEIPEIKDEKGFIKVDEYLRTSIDGIFSCGDCIRTPALAYTAYAEAECVAENLFNSGNKIDYRYLPYAVFGWPEIAWIGELNGKEIRVQSGVSARAYAELERDGFAILFVENNKINGCVLVGAEAAETIHLIESFMVRGDYSRMFFVHPSFSEIVGELMFSFSGKKRHS
ncbi:MAG: NAD(P)/FAD-dependent oxidoreductase [Actinobacteria bacterium]|nr:NAD(P)/FAD-dependent oxidoreductase [Actinomycetota bacterium]